MSAVTQEWFHNLTHMQQSVVIQACRGPDGLHKEHPAKNLLRWFRRCWLVSAFDGRALTDPHEAGGGSFTGPLDPAQSPEDALRVYLKSVDEVPHHFHMHLMHASEILGYKHPVLWIREFWKMAYEAMVRDAHLNVESEADMDARLSDDEAEWLRFHHRIHGVS